PFHGEKDTIIYLQTSETGKLEKLIDERTSCIFTETITNPLQQTPDLVALKRISADNNVPLVIDNTLATPLNCRPLDWGADFVIHSTSKYLSGSNDHGGGVVMIRGKRWQQPLMRLQRHWGLNLLKSEKETLAGNLEDFEKRMERFNRNGEKLARFLKQHPSIARVYHGSLDEEAKVSKS
ncbi:MAG: PLP-dependent transferase, partial [SAR324 cluster bacterium]|nr:PLP-dependent transferase [SAR324 cluster bacterium]